MAFKEILGNENIKETLINSVGEGRPSHSYIFSGPSGVGKKLFAIEFAKLANCESSPGKRPENCTCNSCIKIEKMVHPDVSLFEYEGEKTIKIENIRSDFEEKIYLSPFEGKYKIFILDDAERMNINAQNAFLKTLEEPPPQSIIILLTRSLNFILPTIKSRCQILNFGRVENKLVRELLIKQGLFDTSNIETAVKLSGGSIGKALNLDIEQLEFRENVIRKLNTVRADRPSTIFALYDMLELDSKNKNPEHMQYVFEIISDWVRDLILIKIDSDKDALSNTNMYTELSEYASGKSLAGLLSKPDHLDSAWYGINTLNANKKLAFEDLMIKLSA